MAIGKTEQFYLKDQQFHFALVGYMIAWNLGIFSSVLLSHSALSKNSVMHEVPLLSRSNFYSLSQKDEISNDVAWCPLARLALSALNARHIIFFFDFLYHELCLSISIFPDPSTTIEDWYRGPRTIHHPYILKS